MPNPTRLTPRTDDARETALGLDLSELVDFFIQGLFPDERRIGFLLDRIEGTT